MRLGGFEPLTDGLEPTSTRLVELSSKRLLLISITKILKVFIYPNILI